MRRLEPTTLALLALFIFASHASEAPQDLAGDEARRMVATLDYLAGDYTEAVHPEGGNILNRDEYQEMLRFASTIERMARELGIDRGDVHEKIQSIQSAVQRTLPAADIERRCQDLRDRIMAMYAIPTHPIRFPRSDQTARLFQEACSACHSDDGSAKSPLALSMNPVPRDFTDADTMDRLSPFKAFNSITFGVAGTSMPSFADLSEDERWSLASYVLTFRKGLPNPPISSDPLLHWQVAMRMSNREILERYAQSGSQGPEALSALSQIRHLNYPSEAPLVRWNDAAGVPMHRLSAIEHLDYAIVRSRSEHPRASDLKRGNLVSISLLSWWKPVRLDFSMQSLESARHALLDQRKIPGIELAPAFFLVIVLMMLPGLCACLWIGAEDRDRSRRHGKQGAALAAYGAGAVLGSTALFHSPSDALVPSVVCAAILLMIAPIVRSTARGSSFLSVGYGLSLGTCVGFQLAFQHACLSRQYLRVDPLLFAVEIAAFATIFAGAEWIRRTLEKKRRTASPTENRRMDRPENGTPWLQGSDPSATSRRDSDEIQA